MIVPLKGICYGDINEDEKNNERRERKREEKRIANPMPGIYPPE